MVKTYDFDVTFTCRHEECSDNFKEVAINEVLKLSKYHNHIIYGTITIDKDNTMHKVEILVHVPGKEFTAASTDFDRSKALDEAIQKTKRQLKRLKDKIVDHRKAPLHEVTVETSESDTSDTEE